MEFVYEIIQGNPEYFAWVFGLVNVLWAVFLYFNKQTHDKNLKAIQHDLNLDLERRKKVFELKMSHYESYVRMLDDFGREYQSELFSKMQPLFEKYMNMIFEAKEEKDKTVALSYFSLEVMKLMDKSMKQYHVLKSESRSLKLTASDTMILIFEDLEGLVDDSVESVKQFLHDFPMMMANGKTDEINSKQEAMNHLGLKIQSKSKELEKKMRVELNEI